MKCERFWVVLLAGTLGFASVAHAAERIFVFTDGRKVRGEVSEETPTMIVVKTGGGKMVILRSKLAEVTDSPPKPAPFLEPDEKKKAVAPADEPSAAPRPEPAKAPAPTAGTPAPAAKAGAPLASPAEVQAIRKEALAIAPLAGDAREKALAQLQKTAALATIVALASEPTTEREPLPEHLVALELVERAPFAEVKPLLARAVAAWNPEKGRPGELGTAIVDLGDDEHGTLETALAAKLADCLAAKQSPVPLLRAVERVGSARSLDLAFDGIFTARDVATAAALTDTARLILERSSSIDATLATFARRIPATQLPPIERVSLAVTLFGLSRGAVEFQLEELARAAETAFGATDRAAVDGLLRNVAFALAAINTREAHDGLVRMLENGRSEAGRGNVIQAIETLKVASDDLYDLLVPLVQRIDDPLRSESELKALARALDRVAQTNNGTDTAAWAGYVERLRKSSER